METAGSQVDLCNAAQVCKLFEEALEANRSTPGRKGSVVDLPDRGRLVVTGDLHDNRENFRKIVKLAELDRSADNHLVLHEVIHGPHMVNNLDLSYRMLASVAELKLKYPNQVHLMLANHDLAQINGVGILKHGMNVVEAFESGLDYLFGDRGSDIHDLIARFLKNLPLAVRGANGIFCCHSLPARRHLDDFDATVLDRTLSDHDLAGPSGSAHLMVWGRRFGQDVADRLAAGWGAEVFLMGHQKAEMGCEEVGRSMLIINSDTSHGAAVVADLSRKPNRDQLMEEMVPLAGVML
ncbi:MAG: metallophosphoesterase [Phycisphaeraceae bacterium]|nr:metallophosphoesterase [Phycisphaeraceae bacterium]